MKFGFIHNMNQISGILTAKNAEHPLQLQAVGDEQYYCKVTGWPRTLLVQLHSWSGVKEECLVGETPGTRHALEAIEDCVWVCPSFGGQNNHPQGAGHPAQLERIKRVIDATRAQYPMIERVILQGLSGGGYVSLMFMGAYPGVVYGASLWVFPYDLADWWTQKPQFRPSLEACMGGTPAQVPQQYFTRSPMSVNISGVKLFLNGSDEDVQVPYYQQVEARDRFSPTNDVTFRDFPGGHICQWDVAVAQIRSMQP
jgi:hypothetical protein